MLQHNNANRQPPQQQQQQHQPLNVASNDKWRQQMVTMPVEQQQQQQPLQPQQQSMQPLQQQKSQSYGMANNSNLFSNYVNYQGIPPHTQIQQQANEVNNQIYQQQQTQLPDFSNNIINNNNNNNNNVKNDGWGDWEDWNDNNLAIQQTSHPPPQQQQQLLQTQQQQCQNLNNANVIDDSFNTSNNNNDNWHWNMPLTEQTTNQVTNSTFNHVSNYQQQSLPPPSTTIQNEPSSLLPQHTQQSPPSPQQQQQQQQQFDINNERNLNNNNENFINQPTNIPNSVYVSQAKPVTMPPRQYASPPAGNTPIEPLTPAENIFAPPPEAFQNDPPKMDTPPTIPSTINNTTTAVGNPFKRAGNTQHHRATFIPTTTNVNKNVALTTVSNNNNNNNHVMSNIFVPTTNYEQPDNSEVLLENQEVIVNQNQFQPINDERNQYLQTSHLSENAVEDSNLEADSLPPPGLSRLVLGQPELEVNQRLVTGTEDTLNDGVAALSLDERQADGEDDTTTTNINPLTNNTTVGGSNSNVNNIQISNDRNLYMVPGKSNANNDQLPRVLTGFNNEPTDNNTTQTISEQREIDLDGENLEDQQNKNKQNYALSGVSANRNEPPVEGAAAQIENVPINIPAAVEIKENQQMKNNSMSTGNEESDHHITEQHKKSLNLSRKHFVEDKRKDHNLKKQNSIDNSDSEDYSSDRERETNHRRNYREGSVRSDRERVHEREDEHRRRGGKHESGSSAQDKSREKVYSGGETRTERRSQRYAQQRYEHDSSHEESSRKEKSYSKRHIRERERDLRDRRGERDYDDFNRSYRNSKRYGYDDRRDDERRERERKRDRNDFDTSERRRRRTGHEKPRDPRDLRDPREYEEYRKQSSRNAREGDVEKERGPRYDARYAAMYGYPHQSGSNYGAYDPYAYYYEQIARYNPQAYTDMYKKYYGSQGAVATAGHVSGVGNSSAATATGSDHLTGDGRESVHSGRSSIQNEAER